MITQKVFSLFFSLIVNLFFVKFNICSYSCPSCKIGILSTGTIGPGDAGDVKARKIQGGHVFAIAKEVLERKTDGNHLPPLNLASSTSF